MFKACKLRYLTKYFIYSIFIVGSKKVVHVINMKEQECVRMFTYIDNEQLKKELKKLVIDSGMTQKEVAEKMEVKPQQYTNIVNKENLAFRDVKRIAIACGYELQIDFIPVEQSE